jgi:hypothetical protein
VPDILLSVRRSERFSGPIGIDLPVGRDQSRTSRLTRKVLTHKAATQEPADDARGPERDYRAKRNGTFTINRFSVALIAAG